ncbi:glutathione S-transferase [Rhizopogon vinicolor AM-OR11-026]|uniref:Glutathione S-transferase n=1 Tax=Rhizopogon vinicolor AM-OR11-026 TaxID=1314800 RepID=A0A1B7NGC0_9AGAM|nr:glutathione S-transferase [Rhizopogon vinicolor AM-OR11-026]
MAKPLVLYTAPTSNGYKVSIMLEELKAAYGNLDYDVEKIDLLANVQKEPWFIAMNPNGRIPVLVDRSHSTAAQPNGFPVFESAAIMLYLVQKYDKEGKFKFESGTDEESQMLQWIFFAHGGLGPMQGQVHHFQYYALEDVPYGKKRYGDEVVRLYGVVNIGLEGRDYLVGPGTGKLSVADLNIMPWVRLHKYAGVETLDAFPNLKGWLDRLLDREPVKAGLAVP